MSRATVPMARFSQAVRSISSSANAGRPSGILDSQSRASRYLPRNLKDLKAECGKRGLSKSGSKADLVDRLAAFDIVGSHGFHQSTAPNRRSIPLKTATIYKTGHLMQGFQTSAIRQAAHDSSTIDFFYFPEVPEPPPKNPFAKLRVPLLPDNYYPDRSPESAHAVEELDGAVPRPEISIVASHPEDVIPATISEVVGNDALDISLDKLTAGFSSVTKELPQPSALKQFWDGFLDDFLGPKNGPKAA